jgi:hypothetical protein
MWGVFHRGGGDERRREEPIDAGTNGSRATAANHPPTPPTALTTTARARTGQQPGRVHPLGNGLQRLHDACSPDTCS